LAGELPTLDLVGDRPRPAVRGYSGGAVARAMMNATIGGVRSFAQSQGATLFMTLLAAFQALLHRYTAQEDILIGTPSAGRGRPELAGLLGYLVNPLVLRADLAGEPTAAGLLARARQRALSAFEHQDFPFPLLVERLQPVRDPGRSPLFQAMLVVQRAHLAGLEGLGAFALGESGARIELAGLQLTSLRLERPAAEFELTLTLAETTETAEGSLGASLQYRTDLFDAVTLDRMLAHFETLLTAMVARPEARIGELPLLSGAESGQLVLAEPGTVPAGLLVHQLFEAQAAASPGATALIAGHERLTYGELDLRASRLARRLLALGVGPETLVGVFRERSAEMVVALLAVLKAGGAYVPLDPAHPAERLAWTVADAGIGVILADAATAGRASETSPRATVLLPLEDGELDEAASPLPAAVLPGNLAYVIYTSGSTGRPKGVGIEHRSATALIHWARGVFPPEDLAGVLAATSIAFDLSVFEIFVPLSWGGAVILAANALELPALPAAAAVTLVNTVPSAMAELVR